MSEPLPEIVPGVFVSVGDAVYIVDDNGEVTSWTSSEWDDPEAVTAMVCACILAAKQGASSVRANIRDRGDTLAELIKQTALVKAAQR